jgi:RNA polymerase sigma factor (sigma-70 family)
MSAHVQFETLYAAMWSRLLRIAASLVGRDEAEDVVQSAAVNAFKKWDQFEAGGGGSHEGWLATIVKNEALSRLRRKRGRQFGENEEGDLSGLEPPGVEEVERAERAAIIRGCLEPLSDKERRSLWAKLDNDYDEFIAEYYRSQSADAAYKVAERSSKKVAECIERKLGHPFR